MIEAPIDPCLFCSGAQRGSFEPPPHFLVAEAAPFLPSSASEGPQRQALRVLLDLVAGAIEDSGGKAVVMDEA